MISQQAVQDRVDEFVRLWNQGKLDEAVEGCAEDVTFLGSAGSCLRGRESILQSYRLMRGLYPGGVLKEELIEFRALGETVATAIVRWTFTMLDESETGLALTLYQEIGGRLLAVQGATLSDSSAG